LREYLKKYSFGNATWSDLIAILDTRTREDLAAWSRAWVEERGRPEFTVARGGKTIAITLRDPLRRGLVWPQRLRVTIGGERGIEQKSVFVKGAVTTVDAGEDTPTFVLPNGEGLGYGLFVLDDQSRDYLLANLPDVADPLTRGAAWLTLWDNVLEDRIEPRVFLDLVVRALPQESDEQNTQRLLNSLQTTYWRYLPQKERLARAAAIETLLRGGITRAKTSSQKSAWFSAFRDVAQTSDGLAWLERVWRRDEKVPGLTFAETDEIAMAMELAVREVPAWKEILDTQQGRIQNPDRRERFAFVRPALSAVPAEREASFERFKKVENRRREPWVQEAQAYLNHPLREEHARRFIGPSLELLREIQRTGDIFFPNRWMNATLNGHRSPEAVAIVNDFLARELQYPQRLRWTVLTSLDEVARAADERDGGSR
jgi:aminopeptidase N